jgi:translation initiation factor IF-1
VLAVLTVNSGQSLSVRWYALPEESTVSNFLPVYRGWGLSQIVRLDGYERLDVQLMEDEERSETIIAKERDHFVRITVHEKLTFEPFKLDRTTKLKERITQQQYNELRGSKAILDSPDVVETPQTAKDREDLKAKLWTEFMATAPTCSICQKPMKFRKSARGSFWGCRLYPKCLSNGSFSVASQEAYERWQRV